MMDRRTQRLKLRLRRHAAEAGWGGRRWYPVRCLLRWLFVLAAMALATWMVGDCKL